MCLCRELFEEQHSVVSTKRFEGCELLASGHQVIRVTSPVCLPARGRGGVAEDAGLKRGGWAPQGDRLTVNEALPLRRDAATFRRSKTEGAGYAGAGGGENSWKRRVRVVDIR